MNKMTQQLEGLNRESADSDLHELFLDALANILNAEQQLIKALPRMARAAFSVALKSAFESHLEETEYHITRLEQVFDYLDEPVKSTECKAMKGMLEEGKELMEEREASPILDAALIAAAQKIEHHEIASYGTLCAWAEKLGFDEAVDLLDATLDEEKIADEMLTGIAYIFADESDY